MTIKEEIKQLQYANELWEVIENDSILKVNYKRINFNNGRCTDSTIDLYVTLLIMRGTYKETFENTQLSTLIDGIIENKYSLQGIIEIIEKYGGVD